jgi:hypothetical protein
LNREGFDAAGLVEQVDPFLRECHPGILDAGLTTLLETLATEEGNPWSERRLVSLWLALPRDGAYAPVAAKWDEVFRHRKLFRFLGEDQEGIPVSLGEIAQLPSDVYLAPENLGQAGDVVRAAIRVLRATERLVVQGIQRDEGWLPYVSFQWQSDTDLLVAHFSGEVPTLIKIDSSVALEVLDNSAGTIEVVLPTEPRVCLVALGPDSAPVVQARQEVWINADRAEGMDMIRTLCDENGGRLSLLTACLRFAPDNLGALAAGLGSIEEGADHLGLLRREYVRSLIR